MRSPTAPYFRAIAYDFARCPGPALELVMSARVRQDLPLAGQARAFEDLLQAYRPAVYHLVLPSVPQLDDAQHLTYSPLLYELYLVSLVAMRSDIFEQLDPRTMLL